MNQNQRSKTYSWLLLASPLQSGGHQSNGRKQASCQTIYPKMRNPKLLRIGTKESQYYTLARSKIGARGQSRIARIYGTVRFWYGWYSLSARSVELVGAVGTVCVVRLARLIWYGWCGWYAAVRAVGAVDAV